jgi:filamentous hemagglutinin
MENSHVAAQRLDVKALERQAEAEQIVKKAVFAEAVKFSDEVCRTMFLKKHDIYEVIRGEDGKIALGDDGKPQTRKPTQSERENLKAVNGGRVKVFTNGIFQR